MRSRKLLARRKSDMCVCVCVPSYISGVVASSSVSGAGGAHEESRRVFVLLVRSAFFLRYVVLYESKLTAFGDSSC